MKLIGYMVMERCENYEQALLLRTGPTYPDGGVLDWAANDREARTVFPDRQSAKAAIIRTEHYRLAFSRTDLPERKFCVIVRLGQKREDENDSQP